MPIRFHCQDCQAKIKVPDGAEGRKVKCPRCGAVHRVPAQAVSASSPVHTSETPIGEDLDSLASAVSELSSDDELTDEQFEPDPSPAHDPDVQDPDLDEEASEELFEDEDPDDSGNTEDPLAMLASMADHGPVDQNDGLEETEPEDLADDLFEETPEPDPPSPVAAPDAAKPAIPLARPKPQPTVTAATEPVTNSTPLPEEQEPPKARSRPTSPEPRAIPLSTRPAVHRPTAKPIPLQDPAPASSGPSVAHPSASLTVLLILGWLLRALAVLTVGGAVKLMLVAINVPWPFGDCLLVLLYGLAVSVVIWALGEMALAVRHMATR